MRITILGKLVAIQEGQYRQIVIQNLDEQENSWTRYVTMTICPNWQGNIPKLGDTGFFEFEEVQGGQHFFRVTTREFDQYKYNGCYFLNFIEQKEQIINKDFKFE